MKKALILAGGLGTRLRPLTFAVPKPLIPIRNKPIIDYIISRLIRYGFNDIYISLNYRAEIIRSYLSDKFKKGVRLSYFEENVPLGTAGPLSYFKKKKIRLTPDESILVINGDILTDLDLGKYEADHRRHQADLTVAMINYKHRLSYGVLELSRDNEIEGVKEKPEYEYKASAGIYLVDRPCLDLVPYAPYTMPELIARSKGKGLVVRGYQIKEHWLAIEQIKTLEEASEVKKGDWISRL